MFQQQKFPHLYELGLSNCVTTAEYLHGLLIRHKATLRRLSLSHVHFSENSSTSFFRGIGGKLPALRTVKLRGWFEASAYGVEYFFDIPASESRRIAPRFDAVETFVLEGGHWPNVWNLEEQTCYPWQQKGYRSPGLPVEHDRAEDDRANDYEYDLVGMQM